jgi:hypothetical protein
VLAIRTFRKDLSQNPTLEYRFAGKLLLKEQLGAPIRLLILIGELVCGATLEKRDEVHGCTWETQDEVDGSTKSLWFLTKAANVIGSPLLCKKVDQQYKFGLRRIKIEKKNLRRQAALYFV